LLVGELDGIFEGRKEGDTLLGRTLEGRTLEGGTLESRTLVGWADGSGEGALVDEKVVLIVGVLIAKSHS
jgi:hypothetical protein